MESPTSACSMTSHQAIMKCPWQWRPPFLDEKLESRKRKVGDGNFYDPVDPSFVDHLLPGHAKKFCDARIASEEQEQIQREIERLQMQKHQELEPQSPHESDVVIYDSLVFTNEDVECVASPVASPVASKNQDQDDAVNENQALVDSILLMSKAVEKASLLVSPQSSLSDDDDATSGDDETSLTVSPYMSPCLDLVSDNLEEDFFSADDDALLA